MIIKPTKTVILLLQIIGLVVCGHTQLKAQEQIKPAQLWFDASGKHINAHGGGLIAVKDKYYWFGEKRGKSMSEGVNIYSSSDLVNWHEEGLALNVMDDPTSDISRGCIIERPKVIYNSKTKQFVMWFHLELKGHGYNAARAGVAVSDNVTGPYHFLKSFRPNGNMSRDMTLFVDKNGEAYQIYSSNENYDLRIVRLTDDYLSPTAQDSLLFSKHREAPALFRVKNNYYLITSGCTGWAPNEASVHVAKSLFGPWKYMGDPMSGPDSKTTFGAQSTFVFQIPEKNKWIFMADRWNPKNLTDSRYVWLPIDIDRNGDILINWKDKWSPDE
ncbi:MAG TPA: glycoside hydrolase family 43 protein [Pelobium sp.]|nr:glycoside hydrolase family 43 protein [Pelobium sp.]